MRGLAFALLSVLAFAAPAWAVGSEPAVQGILAIAGKAVPLPAGEWQIVTRGETPASESPAKVALRSALLVRRSGDRIIAAITLHANDSPLPRSLPAPAECKRGDVHLAVVVYETATDAACLWINHIVAGGAPAALDPLWNEAAQALPSGLPPLWLEAGFWIGNRQDVLDIRYHFVPPGDDGPIATGWDESPWSPEKVGETGPRSAAIGELAGWIGGMAPLIDLGLHDRLGLYEPVAMPWTGPVPDVAPGKALRLRQLDALYAAGGISAAAYARQHSILIGEARPAEFTRPNIFVRAGYKALTYRVLGTLDSLVVNWFMFGTLYTSLGMTVAQSVAHGFVYYGHELAWSLAGVSGEKTARWVVLPIGIDR